MPKLYKERHKADALAIAASEESVNLAAIKAGVPRSTLRSWIREPDKHTEAEQRQESKRDFIQAIDVGRWAYLGRLLEPDAIANTSGFYAGVTLKNLTEVHQLLTGGATARIEGSLSAFLSRGSEPTE